MFKPILLMIAALTMTACASGTLPTQTLNLSPPQDGMQACPELPPSESGEMMDLLANHIVVAKLYHQCRDRHQGLVNWLESVDEVR